MTLKKPHKYEVGKTIVFFVRHGDRIYVPELKDAGHVIPGPCLNEKGRKQAKDVAKKLLRLKGQIDIMYCSKMTRAIETAEEISKTIKLKPHEIKELSEFNGTNVWRRKLHTWSFWKNYLLHRESMKALDKILEKNKGKAILIVAHGNIIKGLVFKKLGIPIKKFGGFFSHNNCHITKVRFDGKKLEHINYFNSKDLED